MKITRKYLFNLIGCIFILINFADCYANKKDDIFAESMEWQLISLESSLNIDFEKANELQKITLKSIGDKFYINNTFVNNKEIKSEKVNINNDVIGLINKHVGITKLKDAIYYEANLLNDLYEISQLIIFLPKNDYIFLHTADKFVLTFRPKYSLKNEFFDHYSNLSEIGLPVKSDLISNYEDNYTPLPEYFKFYLGGNYDDDMLHIAKLKSNNFAFKLALLISYNMSGSPSVVLISLSQNLELIDRLALSEQYEKEYGHLDVSSFIDNHYLIKQQEIEYIDSLSPNVLSVNYYFIDSKGYFLEK